MRGELFTIEGKKIFAFGGGESIEKEDRVKAGKWWEREMPTLEEMQHGVDRLDEGGPQGGLHRDPRAPY